MNPSPFFFQFTFWFILILGWSVVWGAIGASVLEAADSRDLLHKPEEYAKALAHLVREHRVEGWTPAGFRCGRALLWALARSLGFGALCMGPVIALVAGLCLLYQTARQIFTPPHTLAR